MVWALWKREAEKNGNGSVDLGVVLACDPILGVLRLERCQEFETSLGYIVSSRTA